MEEEDNALWKHCRLDHGGEKVEFSMNSLKPKPRLVFEDQIFRNLNRDFFSETKFSESDILPKLAKVSNQRSFETEM